MRNLRDEGGELFILRAKSVSILTSTMAMRVPSSEDFTPNRPLAAVRPAFFAAFNELSYVGLRWFYPYHHRPQRVLAVHHAEASTLT